MIDKVVMLALAANISAGVVQIVTMDSAGTVITGEQPLYCETDPQGNILCYY